MMLVVSAEIALWAGELDRLHAMLSGRFRRAEPRRRVRSYIAGLVAGVLRLFPCTTTGSPKPGHMRLPNVTHRYAEWLSARGSRPTVVTVSISRLLMKQATRPRIPNLFNPIHQHAHPACL